MKNRMKTLISVTAAAAALQFGGTANAQLTHYVPFNDGYLPGFDLNGQGAFDLGFGFNVWFDGAAPGEGSMIVEGSLSAAGVLTEGNSVTTPAGFNLAFYTMDQDLDLMNGEPEDALAPGVHWISFIGRSTTEADFGGLSLVKFFGPEILYIGKTGGNGGTTWGVDPGGSQQVGGGDVNVDTFLVAKLTIGPAANDDSVDLYINPAPGATPPATPDVSVAFNEDPANNRAIDEIRLGGQNGGFACDEVRIGATFADVAPADPNAPCLADLVEDGILDLADINAFVAGFTSQGAIADLAEPFGTFDLADINAFVSAFVAGCP